MFIVKDTRKMVDILFAEGEDRSKLHFARREAEFGRDTSLLAANARALGGTRTLSLYGNALAKVTAASMRALPALEELNLGYNALTELPGSLPPSLTRVWLDDNRLTVLPPALLRCPALTLLNLSGNKLT